MFYNASMSKNDDVTRSVHLSSSLHFASLADYRAAGQGQPVLDGQTAHDVDNGYGLQGNPTIHQLQDAVSQLERGGHTLLYPSGSTALNALSALLTSGDHWLMPDNVYAPVVRYAQYLKENYGVTFGFYNPGLIDSLEAAIRPNTKLIHIETPGSATFGLTDVGAVVGLAQARQIRTSADNTWASGVLYQPLEHGVDISVLSLTKYAAGYSDVFMGSLTCKDPELYKTFAYHHRVLGYTVSPFSAMLVSRGLESLPVRIAAHGANAVRLAQACANHDRIGKVYAVDPGAAGFSGVNGLFSIELDRKYSDDELEQAFAALNVFTIGESWGGTRSLVLPFQPEELAGRSSAPGNTLIRWHAGLDDVRAQQHDIEQFLDALPA